MSRKILFLTGTRADFGKLKPLMQGIKKSSEFILDIFVTGMHMHGRYGHTYKEVEKSGFKEFHTHINQRHGDAMDIVLAKTIIGLSDYIHENRPEMLVVHGDRVEALAGAIVGSLNNIRVAHIEGGEISGTIDELIRHSVSKLAHIHFVCNHSAQNRLMNMGELPESIKIIGSPDLDVMRSDKLPLINEVMDHYEIPFREFSIFMYHPVTTEVENLPEHISSTIEGIKNSGENFIAIYPNNDNGSDIILSSLQKLENNQRFKIYPSLRFESFLTLLKNARCIVGNSSAGVREAPVYGTPTVNVGSRQSGRIPDCESVANVSNDSTQISSAIRSLAGSRFPPGATFGDGNSVEYFMTELKDSKTWLINCQKKFNDRHDG